MIFNQNVCGLEKLPGNLRTFFRFQVDRHSSFIPIQHEKRGRLTIEVWRKKLSCGISPVDMFHFNYIGTHISEHPPTYRTGHDVPKFDNKKSVQ